MNPTATASSPFSLLAYPVTRTVDQTDTYHGVAVPDPYRWLEDADSDETGAWVTAQNALTHAFLAQIPYRDAIQKRLTTLWDYEKFSAPTLRGGRYFYSRNNGLQNQYVLYVADGLNDDGRVLLDPNGLSPDGTIALAGTAISDDGTRLAYGLAVAGSDWTEWRVRDVATGDDLPDRLRWVKFSGASWTTDNAGFFYSRYDAPQEGTELQGVNYYQKLYYHKLGDAQEADALIYERPDEKEWGFRGAVTDDGRYLIISVWQGTERKNRVFYKNIVTGATSNAPIVELLAHADANYSFIGNDDGVFYFETDNNAPRGRVIAVDTENPDPASWREVIPQGDDILQDVSLFGFGENARFIANYLQDAHTVFRVFDGSGVYQSDIALPGIGSAGGFGGKRDAPETFYTYSAYTTPTTVYLYDLGTGASSAFRKPDVEFDPDAFETRQVFYTSRDGTRVPLFVTHKKGLALDGANPTYLYGYGGFNASITPFFSVTALVWMEMGGVYAVACLRGGGEYGEAWHEAGKKLNKQNVFDDFIAAGDWLVANGYASPQTLAIAGGSNGGLLVGACMEQRPDLFAVALPAVGVMDMIRFPRFTIGWAWTSDYGSPDDNADEFAALLAYSPYHNVKPGARYPATLVTTGDHDDRVVPGHSFKFAAALQAAQAPDGPPTLIRIETRAGHGAGKPTAKIIQEVADIYAFARHAMNAPPPGDFGA